MARTPRLIVHYRGHVIFRNTAPGSRLRWSAGRFAADTLAGIKYLIRESRD
jgi:hypothetical protein